MPPVPVQPGSGLPDPHGPGPNAAIDEFYAFEAFKTHRAQTMPHLPPATYMDFLSFKQWQDQAAAYHTNPPALPAAQPLSFFQQGAYVQPPGAYIPAPVPVQPPQPLPAPQNAQPRNKHRRSRREAADPDVTRRVDSGSDGDSEPMDSDEDEDGLRRCRRRRLTADRPLTSNKANLTNDQLAFKEQLRVSAYR